MNHKEFEKNVMDMLLAGDDPILEGLRYQYHNSTVESRKFTGAGFYTNFIVKEDIPPVASGKSFQIGDVSVTLKGVKDAIGVILFIKNGYLSFLEGYNLVYDAWPDEYSNVVLEYMSTDGNRDFVKLKAKWA